MNAPALVRIAQTFNTTDAGLMIAYLEGHGIGVFAPHFHMHNTWPMAAAALGGIPICVPQDQAREARALLDALGPMHLPTRPLTLPRVVMFLVFWWAGIAPTLRGVFRAEG